MPSRSHYVFLAVMKLDLIKTDLALKARAGVLTTDHGQIHTPIFIHISTAGSVKNINQSELKADIGAQIILGNTYHLYLFPGTDIPYQARGGAASVYRLGSSDPNR